MTNNINDFDNIDADADNMPSFAKTYAIATAGGFIGTSLFIAFGFVAKKFMECKAKKAA